MPGYVMNVVTTNGIRAWPVRWKVSNMSDQQQDPPADPVQPERENMEDERPAEPGTVGDSASEALGEADPGPDPEDPGPEAPASDPSPEAEAELDQPDDESGREE